MPHWSAGGFWGLMAGALLVLLAGAAAMAIYSFRRIRGRTISPALAVSALGT